MCRRTGSACPWKLETPPGVCPPGAVLHSDFHRRTLSIPRPPSNRDRQEASTLGYRLWDRPTSPEDPYDRHPGGGNAPSFSMPLSEDVHPSPETCDRYSPWL